MMLLARNTTLRLLEHPARKFYLPECGFRTLPPTHKVACMSYSTQKAAASSSDNSVTPLLDQIDEIVKNNDVVIFMKGTPEAPQCGFSRAAAQILSNFPLNISAVDVLSAPDLRETVKKYSNWPTIPQIFVKGQFIGGCDILMDMYRSGQLEEHFRQIDLLKDDNKAS